MVSGRILVYLSFIVTAWCRNSAEGLIRPKDSLSTSHHAPLPRRDPDYPCYYCSGPDDIEAAALTSEDDCDGNLMPIQSETSPRRVREASSSSSALCTANSSILTVSCSSNPAFAATLAPEGVAEMPTGTASRSVTVRGGYALVMRNYQQDTCTN
jgi:hypothetical protein